MSIRWIDLQNIITTEDEINILSGLTASSSELNSLDGFIGTVTDLNGIIGLGASLASHLSDDFITAHTITPNSLDGGTIVDGTVAEAKLSFDIATQTEIDDLETLHNSLQSDHIVLSDRVDTLYGIVIPGQGSDIADSIQQTIEHISNPQNAHDGTAISYIQEGYTLLSDAVTGVTNYFLPTGTVRYFRVDDVIEFEDDITSKEQVTITSVDYSTREIVFTPALSSTFNVVNNAIVRNTDELDVESAIVRSFRTDGEKELILRNQTHTAIVKTADLTGDRTYILPDREGLIGIGDMTFSDVLRVVANDTLGQIDIAPSFLIDLYGEKVRTWISLIQPSNYAGGMIDIATQLSTDGELAGLGSDWLAFHVCITDDDQIRFYYSDTQSVKQDAVDAAPYNVPSVYMKLSLMVVKGDGAGGIDNSTLEAIEDQRPFLNLGVASAFYDESIELPTGLTAGTPINLPVNSRNGGLNQEYIVGSGELEVYYDQIFREPTRDYNEITGSPIGQVSFIYNLPPGVVRFRIAQGSAVGNPLTGGTAGIGTLQQSYNTGSVIVTNSLDGPVTITDGTSGSQKALVIDGDLDLNGFLDPPTGYGLARQSSEPGDLEADYDKLWADLDGNLIFKKYHPTEPLEINVITELETASSSNTDKFKNITGTTIPAFTPVALHPTIAEHIIPADVSSDTSAARIIGTTKAAILHNEEGGIVMSGRLPGAGIGFTHGKLIWADPDVVGGRIAEDAVALTTGNVSVIIGTVDGDDLLVNIMWQGIYST